MTLNTLIATHADRIPINRWQIEQNFANICVKDFCVDCVKAVEASNWSFYHKVGHDIMIVFQAGKEVAIYFRSAANLSSLK